MRAIGNSCVSELLTFRKPVIGLTGGIASGKSYVSERLAQLGATVIDTDLLAREVVEPGTPALAEIREAFGPEAFNADETLNRPALRSRVFADAKARSALEAILHPRIRALALQRSVEVSGRYALVVVPLLAEKGRYDFLDSVVVVDCPVASQRSRLLKRDNISTTLAEQMLASQATRAERLGIADHVIYNDGQRDLTEIILRLDHVLATHSVVR